MSTPPPEHDAVDVTRSFFHRLGLDEDLPVSADRTGCFPDLFRRHLRVQRVDRGRVVCVLSVGPSISNFFKKLHGGAVASVGEMVARACVSTVTGDKDFFLGEVSSTYLSAASLHEEVEIDAQILRQGRSVVVTSLEFKAKESRKLLYTHRATFYNMPSSSL